jgi:proteasome lid subunit RPN8/RPN11
MIRHLPADYHPPYASPAFPVEWTEEVSRAARNHAQACYPAEAVGIVTDGAFVPLINQSSEPGLEVALSDDDWLRAAQAQVFFHSHPDGPACPSEADMRYQMQLGIPFVVVTWPIGDMFCWGDTLEPAPLIGRGFRHGVHDCYSLVRDWYWQQRQVRLADAPRGWEWWNHGQKIYADGLKAAGFVTIPINEAIEPGDGLLFNFRSKTPMHAALVTTPDLLMHHVAGIRAYDPTRLSALVPRLRWARHATLAVRYQPSS